MKAFKDHKGFKLLSTVVELHLLISSQTTCWDPTALAMVQVANDLLDGDI